MLCINPCGDNVTLLSNRTSVLNFSRTLAYILLCLSMTMSLAAQPTWEKTFSPSTIGPGSSTTLTFTINNNTGSNVQDMAFIDNLPAGVTVASPAAASNTCGGSVIATDGGSSVSLANGQLGNGTSCEISVNVTSSTVGVHSNVSGDLTSDAGNSGPASNDLTVATDRPGFTKSFSPSSVDIGEKSTLTFTIDNSANGSDINNLDFTDLLPTGLLVASPSNASTTCGTATFPPTITAVGGTNVITLDANGNFSFPALDANSSCTVTVDVLATAVGNIGNVSGDLLDDFDAVGFATDVLEVNSTGRLLITKEFTDDPLAPGEDGTLRFTITNLDRRDDAVNITFTDDLAGILSGLSADTGSLSEVCGSGSTVTGAGFVTFSGGSLPFNQGLEDGSNECSFDIPISVPASAADGSYLNVSSVVSADIGGDQVDGNAAQDVLVIRSAPVFTKTFTDDPVIAGNNATLEFTISNPTTGNMADIAFEDIFDDILVNATVVPADGDCGPSSNFTFTPLVPVVSGSAIPSRLEMVGGSVDAGSSCTFTIVLVTNDDSPPGIYPNTTSALSAESASGSLTGDPATDNLVVAGAPDISKVFTNDPVAPGGQVTLEFTIAHRLDAQVDATDLEFTDDLDAVLSGLQATGFPISACGGTLNSFDGGSTIEFSGGSVAAGEECTFSVVLNVPVTATVGSYDNVTSALSAMVTGSPTSSAPAEDDLLIGELNFTKEFTNDPVLPGSAATIVFTIENTSSTTVSNIQFTDDFDATLDDLAASGANVINDVCGTGNGIISLSSANRFMSFSGASLGAGEDCSFSLSLDVPAAAVSDSYTNSTSPLTATIDGNNITFPSASDELVVNDLFLGLVKEFTDDPAVPGGTANLRFTVSNLSGSETIDNISFSDDLDAALSGLVAAGLPALNACNVSGTVSGTDVISFSGGSLAPGASCSFDVTVTIPGDAPSGSVHVNTTSDVSGTINGLPVSGDAATDALQIATELPVADAGPNQVGECTGDVTLDGSGSTGVEPLTYNWIEDGEVIATGPSPTVNLSLGTHFITLSVRDANENSDEDEVVISISDGTPPVLTLNGDNPLNVSCGDYEDPGASAEDACDGEVEVEVEDNVDPNTPGSYSVVYSATDAAGNTSTETRTVNVINDDPPVITLNGPNPLNLSCGALYVEPGASALDDCDGNVPVSISGTVDDQTPGSYLVTYSATDSNGNESSTQRTVNVNSDSEDPEISCPPDITQSADPGSCEASVNTGSATASDDCEVSSIVGARSDAPLSLSDPYPVGETTITWTATDGAGNTDVCIQTIIITDDEAPVITVNPDEALTQIWPPNHKYEEFDIEDIISEVTDNCDGDIAINSVTISDASSDEPEDAAGNGDGSTVDDINFPDAGCTTIEVRQERNGSGNGRVYTVNLEVSDAAGNIGTASFFITVPVSQNGSPAVDDGPAYSDSCGGGSFKPTEDPSFLNASVLVAPNPAAEFIRINLQEFSDAPIHIEIFNTQGQAVFTKDLNGLTSNIEDIDISEFENGLFHIVITQDQLRKSTTFIKVR